MLFANNITRRSALQGAGALALAAMLPQGALAKSLVKAGEREVFSFSDGALTLPFSIAAGERKADEVLAVLKAGGMPTDRNIAPLNVTAIKDGDGYTFVDCGAGSRFLDGSGKLGDTIEAAGVDRAKVTRVIFTHAHPDHLWGAIDEMDEPLFPNATYFLSKVDRDFWLSSEQLDKAAEDRKQFFAGAQRIIKALGGKLQTFEPGKEIAPGMMALDTGG
ncbi:MAG: MBL fold metallo-hydrolase, partial [Alphaproteobacteria bacterium]|nr:MBL fold metallo-hydrolase [Alphaproteobacteria bacterium]